jgi:hypothetical protein
MQQNIVRPGVYGEKAVHGDFEIAVSENLQGAGVGSNKRVYGHIQLLKFTTLLDIDSPF